MYKIRLSRPIFKRTLLTVATLIFYIGSASLYADAIQEYEAKAVLVLNLARYSEWPPESGTSTVNACLLGDNVIQQAFAMIDQKQVGNKTLSVHSINATKQLDDCQLLYVSADSENFRQMLEESPKRHILTIGETDDFLTSGGMVYLEMVDAKITLHVNLNATQNAGVQISARVLKLATIFNP